jgi:PPE-repeat protein
MRRLTTLGVGLALMVLVVGSAGASHSWGTYHWERSANPLALAIASNLSGAYDSHLATAVGDWNRSKVLSLSTTGGAGLDKCGAVAGRVEVCNDRYGFRQGGWLGMARIWASGDHIVQATVQMNDTFLVDDSRYNSSAWKQMVVCQEIGHAFGLDHQDENFGNPNLGTCMDYTRDPGSNQHPNRHDYEELESIYAHLDGAGGGGGGGGGGNCPPRNPKCGNGGIGNAPPFSQASRANGSVYVDRLPGGVTRVTHVLWVPDR